MSKMPVVQKINSIFLFLLFMVAVLKRKNFSLQERPEILSLAGEIQRVELHGVSAGFGAFEKSYKTVVFSLSGHDKGDVPQLVLGFQGFFAEAGVQIDAHFLGFIGHIAGEAYELVAGREYGVQRRNVLLGVGIILAQNNERTDGLKPEAEIGLERGYFFRFLADIRRHKNNETSQNGRDAGGY
jgi:hypothetical protein